jgi:hypothetical protein
MVNWELGHRGPDLRSIPTVLAGWALISGEQLGVTEGTVVNWELGHWARIHAASPQCWPGWVLIPVPAVRHFLSRSGGFGRAAASPQRECRAPWG